MTRQSATATPASTGRSESRASAQEGPALFVAGRMSLTGRPPRALPDPGPDRETAGHADDGSDAVAPP